MQEARKAIAKMTPEERTAMGLPEVGWESLIGLEDDSADSDAERP
jgi:hypothetical protein